MALRWRDGFVCPACGARSGWSTARGYVQCSGCQRQTSATAGTIFHRTRHPLRTWLEVAWYVTTQKPGASALGLQRVLGLGSYQTAWSWLHKLRRAMVRPGREQLSGEVEVDETLLGGRSSWKGGRSGRNKAVVVIAAEIRGRAIGRIRMARVPDASADSLGSFVREVVSPGAVVRTDGWSGYNVLAGSGYDHRPTSLRATGEPGHVAMPGVHRVAALLDRWWLGTHQGAIAHRHLDYYLDEFTFRFNRRASRSRGLLFYRLVEQALQTDPLSYREFVGGTSNHQM
jgi:transposase-like protein